MKTVQELREATGITRLGLARHVEGTSVTISTSAPAMHRSPPVPLPSAQCYRLVSDNAATATGSILRRPCGLTTDSFLLSRCDGFSTSRRRLQVGKRETEWRAAASIAAARATPVLVSWVVVLRHFGGGDPAGRQYAWAAWAADRALRHPGGCRDHLGPDDPGSEPLRPLRRPAGSETIPGARLPL